MKRELHSGGSQVVMAVLLGFSLFVSVALAEEAKETTPPRTEVDLVEKVVVARDAYEASLVALVDYYSRIGNEVKRKWAQEELEGYGKQVKHKYVLVVHVVDARINPVKAIPEANDLYQVGLDLKEIFRPLGKKKILHRALEKFEQILVKYPESNKCPDAAFRMAQIYDGRHFKDPYRAAECYKACFRWDPKTPYEARYRAARVYDLKLKDYDKAIELYKLAVEEEREKRTQKKAAARLDELQEHVGSTEETE